MNYLHHKPVLVLIGPTAIGKTEFSLRLAEKWNCEIVSVDSMQVYRYMDIGTAKASIAARQAIPHHLIDIVDPDEHYDAARFAIDARQAVAGIHGRNRLPLLTGGTGMYLQAALFGLTQGIGSDHSIRLELIARLERDGARKLHEELFICDRKSAERISVNDTYRILRAIEVYRITGIPWSEHIRAAQQDPAQNYYPNCLQICLTCDRDRLYQRINHRCRQMIAMGLEQEVRTLLSRGYSKALKPMGAIGYRHMVQYLDGVLGQAEMIELLARDTRRYAKRQYTWFRKMENLHWIDINHAQAVDDCVSTWCERFV
jgi:tRNA dimethylallyltransferase